MPDRLLYRRCTVTIPTRTAGRERRGTIVGVGLPLVLVQLEDPPPALYPVGGTVVRRLDDIQLRAALNRIS